MTVRPAAPDEPPADEPAAERQTVLVEERSAGGRETVKLSGRRPPQRVRRAPLPVAAGFATLWAAILCYLPVAAVIGLARTLEGQGGLAGAAHGGLAGWLLGHGVPIGTSTGPLGLAPLLLTLLVVWRLNRAGLHVTRAIGARRSGSIGDALLVAFAIGLGYSLLGSVAALAVDGPGIDVAPAHAAINFFLIGGAGALVGSLRGTDALSVLAGRMPRVVRTYVQISDNGPGIGKKDLPRVFNRFDRVRHDPSRGEAALGLGLPLARQFVEAHGGKIDLVSTKGKGTTVTLTIPRAPK
jgi:hypothetical protein